MRAKLRKLWQGLDTEMKLFIGCLALYAAVYVVADMCELITWLLLYR